MSDCSTHAFEYPGMSRLIIRWTDQHERPHDWPFVTLGREVASVEVDGIEYVNAEKLKAINGELCAQVNELQARIAELETMMTCEFTPDGMANGKMWLACSACNGYVSADYDPPRYCPHCGAKVRNE